jgi:hypothetical protein
MKSMLMRPMGEERDDYRNKYDDRTRTTIFDGRPLPTS